MSLIHINQHVRMSIIIIYQGLMSCVDFKDYIHNELGIAIYIYQNID